MKELNIKYQQIKAIYEGLGHRFFDNGNWNVNLFGIRTCYDVVDEFNDYLGIAYRDERGIERCIIHPGTTKPGLYWLAQNLGNPQGTFILAPGQYPQCWKIGQHKGYEALAQVGSPFLGWRDDDQDSMLDPNGKMYKDVTGLNMHTTSFINHKEKVGAYSAGCQVRQRATHHTEVMAILRMSAKMYGNSFTYTLIHSLLH